MQFQELEFCKVEDFLTDCVADFLNKTFLGYII